MLPDLLINIIGPEKVAEEIRNIQNLQEESYRLSELMPTDLPEGTVLDKQQSSDTIKSFSATISVETAYVRLATMALNIVNENKELQDYYHTYKEPTGDVIRAQIVQYFYPDKTVSELISVVKLQQKMAEIVQSTVARWEKELEG